MSSALKTESAIAGNIVSNDPHESDVSELRLEDLFYPKGNIDGYIF